MVRTIPAWEYQRCSILKHYKTIDTDSTVEEKMETIMDILSRDNNLDNDFLEIINSNILKAEAEKSRVDNKTIDIVKHKQNNIEGN